jgi:hypothetical protein
VSLGDAFRREHGVEADDAFAFGVAADGVDEVAQEGETAGALGAELLDVRFVPQGEDAGEQLGLGTEVVQDAGLGDAGAVGDLLQGGVVVAAGGEGVHGDLQDFLPSLLGFEALPRTRLRLPVRRALAHRLESTGLSISGHGPIKQGKELRHKDLLST